MQISQRVQASTLEELNLADDVTQQRTMLIAKEMQTEKKTELKELLHQYKDVFAQSYEDVKGLDPALYQHQINISKDGKPVQQRDYRMNLDYAIKVKEN